MLKAVSILLLALAGSVFSPAAQAAAEFDPHSLAVEQREGGKLEFRFRLTEPEAVAGVEAAAGGRKLAAEFTPFAQQAGAAAAYLFLLDRSDPKRAKTVEASKALVLRLLDRAEPAVKFSVYAFAADLEPVAEFGATKEEVREKLKAVKAGGMATELYRDAIEAIKVLEGTEAARKALVIFSDGRAEDTTFTLEQVLARAREARVTIFAVGYAEAAPLTVHLQSLRRLAAETGGVFAEAEIATKKEPEAFTRDFFSYLASGGMAVVDAAGVKPGEVIDFAVTTKESRVLKHAHTVTGGTAPEAAPPPAEPAPRRWPLYAAAGAVLAGGLLVFFLTKRAAPAPGPAHIYARLKLLDGDGTEHVMTATALRLGRGADNDVTLRNDSISRHHAEIHRARDGSFAITDLGAGNGVLVNGEKVERATLKHEDVIELGEVRLRFLIA